MDAFYEQLVTTQKTSAYSACNTLAYVFGGLGVLALGMRHILIAILLILIASALYFYKGNLFVEFQYDFTNGEIDVDKILEMKKRKRVISFDIKKVELIAPENSDYVKNYSKPAVSTINAVTFNSNDKVYNAYFLQDNQIIKLRFTPNEKFLDFCYKYNPRAIKKVWLKKQADKINSACFLLNEGVSI